MTQRLVNASFTSLGHEPVDEMSLEQHMLQSLVLSPHVTPPVGQGESLEPPQHLLISNFPPHEVTRLADEWEWMVSNDNVTFVSCDEAGTISYAGRGFNAESSEVIHPDLAAAMQHGGHPQPADEEDDGAELEDEVAEEVEDDDE